RIECIPIGATLSAELPRHYTTPEFILFPLPQGYGQCVDLVFEPQTFSVIILLVFQRTTTQKAGISVISGCA
ncbi:hypothetical protein, partial [Enterobacter cloacae]|uniref:hypothetical protein n=1 Tax=Enterobacter cloacae TaxID=550 RepID=UPI00214732B7